MAAMDLAQIGFAARTDGLLKAKKGLNDLSGAAKDAQVTMSHLESTTGRTNNQFSATRQKLNPAYQAMVEYRGTLREISTAAKQGAISEMEASNARLIARRGAEQTVSSYNRLIAATRGHTAASQANVLALQAQAKAARYSSHMSRQLSFQLVDIGQALATAPTMGIYALQNLGFQVAQIGQLYMGQGGFNQAVKDSAAQVATFATRLGPAVIAVGVLALALVGLQAEINATSGASVSLINVAIATMQELAASVMNTAAPAFQWLGRVVKGTGVLIFDTLKLIGNSVVNTFSFSYLAVVATWKKLPAALGDLMYQAAQKVLDGLSDLIQAGINDINTAIRLMNSITPGEGISEIDPFQGFQLPNPFEDEASNLATAYKEAYGEFLNNPMGDYFDRVGERARNMADDTDAAAASLNGFQSAVRSIQRSTQALWDEANFFGPEFTYDLLQHQKAQQLLNAAMDAGVTITDQVRARIQGLASEYVSATQNLDLLRAAQRSYEEMMGFARKTTRSFITDMRNGLEEGKGFWRSFGDAVANAIGKVSDRMLDQLLDAIFQVNSASRGMFGGSSGGGGLFGGILGGIGSLIGGSSSSLGFGPGTSMPVYHSGIDFVPETGPAWLQRGERVVPANENRTGGSGGVSVIRLELSPDIEARIIEQGAKNSIKIVDAKTPGIAAQSADLYRKQVHSGGVRA